MSTPIINAQMDAINGTMATLKGDLTTLRPLIKTLKETALNAYATESLSNQAVASFTDGAKNIPVKSLAVAINPIQTGTGDPSPTNIRPISGHTEVNVYVQSEYDASADPTVTIPLGQTVYGGTLNVTTGVLTVEYAKKTMTGTGSNQGTSFAGKASISNVDGYYAQFYQSNGAADIPLTDVIDHIRCSHAKVVAYADAADEARAGTVVFTWSTTTGTPVRIQPRIYFPTSLGINTQAKANQFLADQYAAGTPVEYIYELATPTTVQLTPTEVATLLGQNNIWADTGDILEVTIRCDTALYIQKLVG